MKIKTVHVGHPGLSISCEDVEISARTFCADSWCQGECKMPALVTKFIGPDGTETEFKAHGSMVACGPVWQRFRSEWNGEKVYVPSDKSMLELMWW